MVASSAPAPVRTTIATGVPTRIATGKPTAMDELVGRLPQIASAGAAAPAASPPVTGSVSPSSSQPWRYHVTPELDEKPSADEFEAWMSSRGVRVATGKPATPATRPPEPAPAAAQIAQAPPPVSAAREITPAPAAAPGDVRLQVASFASRENADRALARLNAAGITRASLSDVASNGRTLWRLRVDAPDQTAASELAGRIAGMGFGHPQVVNE